jgi:hypothetical protein
MNVIETIDLFPVLNEKLISFLKRLSPGEWNLQTVAKKWAVKDVASHLLDGNFRRIAMHRDGWLNVAGRIDSYEDLVNYLNELNADWVKATKRLSPQIITGLLEQTNGQVYDIFKNLDPFAPSIFPVSWAGEKESQNWMDIAREYTERWLHQQQVREALGDKTLLNEELYHPLLNIFMQAWPHVCREAIADNGTVLKTTITGNGGGEWYLQKQNGVWKLSEPAAAIKAETSIDGTIAWILFSKSVRKEAVKEFISIKGDQQLGEKVLDMVSVMA